MLIFQILILFPQEHQQPLSISFLKLLINAFYFVLLLEKYTFCITWKNVTCWTRVYSHLCAQRLRNYLQKMAKLSHKIVRSNISTFFSNLILGTLHPPEFCTNIFKEFSLKILQACKKKLWNRTNSVLYSVLRRKYSA